MIEMQIYCLIIIQSNGKIALFSGNQKSSRIEGSGEPSLMKVKDLSWKGLFMKKHVSIAAAFSLS